MKQRIALLVYVDLDPVPGAFHTPDSAKTNIDGLLQDLARNKVADHLEEMVNLYNPIVAHAPESLQPPNHPRNMNDSQEIPRMQTIEESQPRVIDLGYPIPGTVIDVINVDTNVSPIIRNPGMVLSEAEYRTYLPANDLEAQNYIKGTN